jgi:signal-transduction protein with cAMP-binding, CBS, and nucleotidyltransferase domain
MDHLSPAKLELGTAIAIGSGGTPTGRGQPSAKSIIQEKERKLAKAMMPIIAARRASAVLMNVLDNEDNKRINLMKSVKSMEKLSMEQLKDVVRFLLRRDCRAGEEVFREGDIGEELFIIENGTLAVTKSMAASGDKKVAVVATMSKGISFGEIALLKDCRRTATVTCMTDASLLVLKRNHFDICLKKHQVQIKNQLRVWSVL